MKRVLLELYLEDLEGLEKEVSRRILSCLPIINLLLSWNSTYMFSLNPHYSLYHYWVYYSD